MGRLWWKGRSVFVTGSTGAWGQEICRQLLALPVARVVAYARGEHRVAELAEDLADDRLRIRLGDIRDAARLRSALTGCDLVIHGAALKRIDAQINSALEIVKTNINGTINMLEACIALRPEKAIFISSDKAVAARNLYGCTKAVGEHVWLAGNDYAPAPHPCRFSVMRSGNALGSTGSVVHIWRKQVQQEKPLTVTDPTMSRFHITLGDAVRFLLESLETATGGEVFIPQMCAYTLRTLYKAFAPGYPFIVIGQRGPGEKQHETITLGGPTSCEVKQLSVEELRGILAQEGLLCV
jgi:UDP-N-acetylglucosamine 4,6-dehydratase/5-epimerase